MTQEEVRAFCANNGISVSAPGQPLHVVNPDELPPSVREFVNDDGSYSGDDTPEAEDEKSTNASAESTSAKRGKLPDDFPHRAALTEAGFDTYAKVRGLNGDYSEVTGIGDARGKEVDEAL